MLCDFLSQKLLELNPLPPCRVRENCLPCMNLNTDRLKFQALPLFFSATVPSSSSSYFFINLKKKKCGKRACRFLIKSGYCSLNAWRLCYSWSDLSLLSSEFSMSYLEHVSTFSACYLSFDKKYFEISLVHFAVSGERLWLI